LSLVLDASMTLSWYFEDERTPAADGVLDQVVDRGAIVPALWRLEVANGLAIAIRRDRIDLPFRDSAISQLAGMPIIVDQDTDTFAWTTTLHLADRFRLTPYDAAYLELAQRRKVPLATLDRALAGAAPSIGVTVIGMGR
jgi:predicted nucleic acid-binding protein